MEESNNNVPDHKTPQHDSKSGRKKRSLMAVIALILAIIGLLLSPIPIVNNFAFVIAILGLVAGIIGWVRTKKNRRKGRNMAIVSVVLSVLACVIVLASQAFYGNAIDSAGKQIDKSLGNASGENTDKILGKDVSVTLGTFKVTTPDEFTTDTELPVKVTNKSSQSQSYSIQIEAVDKSGSRIDDDTVYTDNLGSNQSQNFKAFQYADPDKVEALKAAKFKVASVSQY